MLRHIYFYYSLHVTDSDPHITAAASLPAQGENISSKRIH